MRRSYPVALMCRVLDVSKSGFHARKARQPCDRERENARLEIEILSAHQRTRETYSAMRLHRDLADHGIHSAHFTVFEHCARSLGFVVSKS